MNAPPTRASGAAGGVKRPNSLRADAGGRYGMNTTPLT